ncbi:uncharacterized protein LOC130614585 isoform X1 [Hydractinia symbiolongicarpus]|uniref:uncharacterized protein LOC130614585 isoform X1 n=1 Tax=Hydractinia symbiolongicarpus TaxID=13093 RepID=UPI00254B9E5D|nr:uncharacterized protein LOC130614585 isoform X1 [Hydractinia symbiolongicarpus]
MDILFLSLLTFIVVHYESSVVDCRKSSSELCFPIIGDIGGVPHPPYQTPSQKKVANLLGKVTAKLNCKFIVGVGDNFYFTGVKNVNDPRFLLTFERTYSDPSLNIPWYMIAGNHDHAQNISAQIEYTKVSTRWKYPDYYYSVVYPIPDSNKTVEIVMIDTTMLCWYNKKSGSPPPEVQYKWIENKLKDSRADYLIVAGHHPVLSAGTHGNTPCLIEKLKPLFEKYDVTAYFSGHDHNLQHIKEKDSSVHYFISGSGNFVDSRMTSKNKLSPSSLKFEHGLFGGFILARVNKDFMELHYTNTEPKKLYQLKIKPRLRKNFKEYYEKINPAKIKFKMPSLTQKLVGNPSQAVANTPRKPPSMFQSNIDHQLKKVPLLSYKYTHKHSNTNNSQNTNINRTNKQHKNIKNTKLKKNITADSNKSNTTKLNYRHSTTLSHDNQPTLSYTRSYYTSYPYANDGSLQNIRSSYTYNQQRQYNPNIYNPYSNTIQQQLRTDTTYQQTSPPLFPLTSYTSNSDFYYNMIQPKGSEINYYPRVYAPTRFQAKIKKTYLYKSQNAFSQYPLLDNPSVLYHKYVGESRMYTEKSNLSNTVSANLSKNPENDLQNPLKLLSDFYAVQGDSKKKIDSAQRLWTFLRSNTAKNSS